MVHILVHRMKPYILQLVSHIFGLMDMETIMISYVLKSREMMIESKVCPLISESLVHSLDGKIIFIMLSSLPSLINLSIKWANNIQLFNKKHVLTVSDFNFYIPDSFMDNQVDENVQKFHR